MHGKDNGNIPIGIEHFLKISVKVYDIENWLSGFKLTLPGAEKVKYKGGILTKKFSKSYKFRK